MELLKGQFMELRGQLSNMRTSSIEGRHRNLSKSVSVLILRAIIDEMASQSKEVQSQISDQTSTCLELEVKNAAMQAEFKRRYEA